MISTQNDPGRSRAQSARNAWPLPTLGLLFALLLLTGCSSFSQKWESAGGPPRDPLGIEGRWIGTWQNTNNTHADRMRAVMVPVGTNEYRVHFHAKYKKVLGFKYEATFRGRAEGGVFVFQGREDLGTLAGGVYTYTGRVSPETFYSTYESKYDSGTFTLKRP